MLLDFLSSRCVLLLSVHVLNIPCIPFICSTQTSACEFECVTKLISLVSVPLWYTDDALSSVSIFSFLTLVCLRSVSLCFFNENYSVLIDIIVIIIIL